MAQCVQSPYTERTPQMLRTSLTRMARSSSALAVSLSIAIAGVATAACGGGAGESDASSEGPLQEGPTASLFAELDAADVSEFVPRSTGATSSLQSAFTWSHGGNTFVVTETTNEDDVGLPRLGTSTIGTAVRHTDPGYDAWHHWYQTSVTVRWRAALLKAYAAASTSAMVSDEKGEAKEQCEGYWRRKLSYITNAPVNYLWDSPMGKMLVCDFPPHTTFVVIEPVSSLAMRVMSDKGSGTLRDGETVVVTITTP